MNPLEVANMQLAAGNKQAAERTLYGNGLTWHDLSIYQQSRVKLQRPPPEHELPPSLRGLAGTRGLTNRIPSWNYVAPRPGSLFAPKPVPPKKVGPWRMPINTNKHPIYQSPPIMRVPKGVMAGLADATLSAAMPDDNATIQDQLASIRMDWATGNLWVGNNKYSLVTTLIGGLVIKGMLFGGNKIAALGKKVVGRGGEAAPA